MALSVQKQKLVHRLHTSKLREREGFFLVEGVRGVEEVLKATLPLAVRFAVLSPRLDGSERGKELRRVLEDRGISVEEVGDPELAPLAATERHQGVLLVVEEPEWSPPPFSGAKRPRRLLLLDGIQDPGNVGTLLRGARAFGLTGVLALEGTADPWNPKAVRAGAGAWAHLPMARRPWVEVREWLRDESIPLLAADASGRNMRGLPAPANWALALGNEGAGVRGEILAEAREVLAIPMAPGVDSLNVSMAGTVVMYSLTGSVEEEGEGS